MLEINSSKYIKERKVLLDGITVTMRPPGAGTELSFGRIQRRLDFLDKKVKAGTVTSEELDQFDKLENQMLGYFNEMLRDGTAKNEKVWAWLNKTPLSVIQAAFDEMKRQFEATDNQLEAGDEPGTTEELPRTEA